MPATVAPCPNNCANADLLKLPVNNCATDFRRTTPSRLFMFNCDVPIPTGSAAAVGTAVAALFTAGDIVSSMPLANIVFEEPQYEEVQIDDCAPATSLLTTRAMTFEDRYAVDISAISPFVSNKFFDYDFWQNKIDHQTQVRFMLAYCNGDVRLIEYRGTIRGFVDYLKAQNAGGASTEVKKFRIIFNGDPLAMTSKPIFNYIDAGIAL